MPSSKKIAFIVPYFGHLPNYFTLWLKSCEQNPQITWLLFTDDKTEYNYPQNVIVHYRTFQQIINLFQNNFEFKINLNNPYHLCEYKVAYGEVFKEYLIDYEFWGYCDIDLIWGDFSSFLSNETLSIYEKISWRGHMTIFSNKQHINSLYRNKLGGVDIYKIVFSNPWNYPVAFDELWINLLFTQENIPIYNKIPFADLKIRSTNFELLHFKNQENYKNKNQIFSWENGKLYRLYVHQNMIWKEEFLYIHFLKRKMTLKPKLELKENFLIVPNEFINAPKHISIEFIKKLTKERIYVKYILERITLNYIISKFNYLKAKKNFFDEYNNLPSAFYEIKIDAIESTKIGAYYKQA